MADDGLYLSNPAPQDRQILANHLEHQPAHISCKAHVNKGNVSKEHGSAAGREA